MKSRAEPRDPVMAFDRVRAHRNHPNHREAKVRAFDHEMQADVVDAV